MGRASFTAVSTTAKAQHPRRMITLAVLLFVVLHAFFLPDGWRDYAKYLFYDRYRGIQQGQTIKYHVQQ